MLSEEKVDVKENSIYNIDSSLLKILLFSEQEN